MRYGNTYKRARWRLVTMWYRKALSSRAPLLMAIQAMQSVNRFYCNLHNLPATPVITLPLSNSLPDLSSKRDLAEMLNLRDGSDERANVRLTLGQVVVRTDTFQRRRESNRLAQRAYRDRKENLLRYLEGQVAVWEAKHRELSQSHSAQNVEISRLKTQIDKLTNHLESLYSDLPSVLEPLCQNPQEFDLVPMPSLQGGTPS